MASNRYHGGMIFTPEMRRILSQPGYISSEKGGQRLRDLYRENSAGFTTNHLSDFGTAPDLKGAETNYNFGYATLIVAGAQRVASAPPDWGSLRHAETLSYLLAKSLPADVPDIVGLTALHHGITGDLCQVELARILITEGKADVNYQNRYGEVPLMGAFQQNHIQGIELLMESGADLSLKDAEDLSPETFYLMCGPQVTAVIRKWIGKGKGEEAPRAEKKCDGCGAGNARLKNCAKCQVARYCSKECQKQHWPTHKKTCIPFSPSNTVVLKPYYHQHGTTMHTSTLTRNLLGIPTSPQPQSHARAAHVPKNLSTKDKKDIVVKIQLPYDLELNQPSRSFTGDLLIYTKKRDFVCTVRKHDCPDAYDAVTRKILDKGVGGSKAYFAAELKSKDELVVKVAEVLAEQPF
ncbi:hypothetical protein AX17_001599 [Amanita inopinata Kibby_2008]|nr:hypothetical protein AX17_001599 [Amanita inopinata Kibby_2008]